MQLQWKLLEWKWVLPKVKSAESQKSIEISNQSIGRIFEEMCCCTGKPRCFCCKKFFLLFLTICNILGSGITLTTFIIQLIDEGKHEAWRKEMGITSNRFDTAKQVSLGLSYLIRN